jgi:hypothetical protein
MTASAALAAIAASTAEPPDCSASTPACEASAWGETTMPCGAMVTGRPVSKSVRWGDMGAPEYRCATCACPWPGSR